MTKHPTVPCSSCPYRTDTRLAHWHREEFERVQASEVAIIGSVFACHKHLDLPDKERGTCAGFMLDQKERGIPNLGVRMALSRDPELAKALEKVRAPKGVRMYSADRMCEANFRAIDMQRKSK